MRGALSYLTVLLIAVALVLWLDQPASAQSSGEVDGGTVFMSTCSTCHGRSGQGVRGAFPPLADHLDGLIAAEDGRSYVISVVLFGLQGEIMVDGVPFNGVMPAQGHLSDQEVAAVLNHIVTELGDESPSEFEPVQADEVAAARENQLATAEVREMRPDTTADEPDEPQATLPPSFTNAQADRGNAVYQNQCVECHGSSLQGGVVGGPPLRGSYFDQRWGGRSVAALFEYTRARMPQNRPGSLSDQQYADIVALILRSNGHSPGGGELPASSEALQRFLIGR